MQKQMKKASGLSKMSLKITKAGKLPELDVKFDENILNEHVNKYLMRLHSRLLAAQKASQPARTLMMRDSITGKFVQETQGHSQRIEIIYEALVHSQTYH